VLPPTSSVEAAAARLESVPTGGRTPLAEGLLAADRILRVERLRDPRRRPLVVVVTDGRATAGPRAVDRSVRAAGVLAASGAACVVVDCETGPVRLGLADRLARVLGAERYPLAEVAWEPAPGPGPGPSTIRREQTRREQTRPEQTRPEQTRSAA
jgi:magnesium chelatase subunit D